MDSFIYKYWLFSESSWKPITAPDISIHEHYEWTPNQFFSNAPELTGPIHIDNLQGYIGSFKMDVNFFVFSRVANYLRLNDISMSTVKVLLQMLNEIERETTYSDEQFRRHPDETSRTSTKIWLLLVKDYRKLKFMWKWTTRHTRLTILEGRPLVYVCDLMVPSAVVLGLCAFSGDVKLVIDGQYYDLSREEDELYYFLNKIFWVLKACWTFLCLLCRLVLLLTLDT